MNADQPAVSPVGPLESYCPRSLMPTLVGALTMLVLFTAQTWGFQVSDAFASNGSSDAQASSETVEEDDCGKGFTWILVTMCQPLLFLHTHVLLAFEAWKMHQRLKKKRGIKSLRASTKWTNDSKYWDPRSLRCLLGARAWIKLAPALPVEGTTSPVAARSSKAEISNPLEIFPPMMLNQSPLHESEGQSSEGHQSSGAGDQTSGAGDQTSNELGKQALLELGFVPTYDQLRYVKSKSGVEIAIVAVQAAGYLLGILERMAADQRISPVEALATFLGILMILHALLELFACPAYKRTLLFHLYPPQFSAWRVRLNSIQEAQRSATEAEAEAQRSAPEAEAEAEAQRFAPDPQSQKQKHSAPRSDPEADPQCSAELKAQLLVLLLICLTILLPLVPAIYFAVDFLVPHDHRCLICFIPALFFSLNLLLLASYIAINFIDNDKINKYVGTTLLCVLVLLYVSSFVVAVIGTVLEWDHKFNEPTKSWYRWIIPHIGS